MFEWDEAKSRFTLADRGFDFAYAIRIFDGFVVELDSPRYGEHRVKATGEVDGKHLTVIYVWRDGKRRNISARRAWPKEVREYDYARRQPSR